jgi:hypothetical protein
MPTHADSSCWVMPPVGERSDGSWVDETLGTRLRETPLPGLPLPPADIPRRRVEVVRGPDAERRAATAFVERGWTDGLPIVVPTLARVEAMLRTSPLPGHHVLGDMEPLRGLATVEKVACNAVMAGCAPGVFPVVLAAVTAVLDPAFNLRGVQTTDENVAPLVIVSGPAVERLGINGGIGALGPGWRANATIGRAIRLVMSNVGGGWPGVVSLAGIGQPARYGLCVAEDPRISPWPALHADAGLDAAASAVTVMRAESAVNVTGGLADVASVMASATSGFSVLHGGCVAVLLAPHVARQLVREGCSRADVAARLHVLGRWPAEAWRRSWICGHVASTYGVPAWVQEADRKGEAIPVVERPEDIVVFVAGGDAPIPQCVYFPTWGFPNCRITVPIRLPRDGG